MKRRRSELSFTLFPFLAVLMCTMGALVLLLLVTTRQMRERAVEQQQQQARAVAGAESYVPIVVPHVAGLPAADEPIPLEGVSPPELSPIEAAVETASPLPVTADHPLLPELVDDPPATGPSAAELARQAYERQRSQRAAELTQLREEWEQQVRELMRQRDRSARDLARSKELVGTEQQRVEQLRRDQQMIATKLQQLVKERQGQQQLQSALLQEQQRAEQALEQIKSLEKHAQSRTLEPKTRLSVMSHGGQSGTQRRAIMIECRANEIRFASEGVSLTSQQLSGFTPDYNPLQLGAEVLRRYWAQRDSDRGDEADPYVLLVVRPDGTEAFYVAQMLLAKVKVEGGYELVLQDEQIVWPEADPEAAAICRQAVEQMLAERERIVAKVRNGRLPVHGELDFVGPDGGFRLQEVERLRNADDPYAIANPTWANPHRRSLDVDWRSTQGRRVFTPRSEPEWSASRGPSLDHPGSSDAAIQGGGKAGSGPGSLGSESIESTDGNPFARPLQRGSVAGGSSQGPSGSGHESGTGTEAGGGTIVPPDPDAQFGNAHQTGTAALDPTRLRSNDNSRTNPGTESSTASGEPGRPGQRVTPGMAPPHPGAAGSRAPGSGSMSGESSPIPLPQSTPSNVPPGQAAGDPNEWLNDGGRNRRWGAPPRSNAIGLERDVVLDVWTDAVALEGAEQRTQLEAAIARQDLQRLVAALIEEQIADWGPAPASFMWRPTLRVRIHPGGHVHSGRIGEVARHWGFRMQTETLLE
ncbi:MAG: hypothetical protein KDA58_00040 [Planctomycetaceae bacterium]|nr:hypothetical protein [Planctomycetaceae bacterium]